jgi:hypothetical protein
MSLVVGVLIELQKKTEKNRNKYLIKKILNRVSSQYDLKSWQPMMKDFDE